jgi:hypothetical protein
MTTPKELLDDVTEQEINEQRIIFVREAAIRLTSAYYALNLKDQDFKSIWIAANGLWYNKPEDC